MNVTIWTDEPDFYLEETDYAIDAWSKEFCPSYKGFEVLDMSDISSWARPDTGYQYSFSDEKDVIMFTLKWGDYVNCAK